MKTSLDQLLSWLENKHIRLPLIISGEQEWCYQHVSELTKRVHSNHDKTFLVVSRSADSILPDIKLLDTNIQSIEPNKVNTYLGTEVDCLIWDGFDGLSPSGLGAASGLVRGGGLMCILLPTLDELVQRPDPDYARMCSFEDEIQHCQTRFLQHFTQLIQSLPTATLTMSAPELGADSPASLTVNHAPMIETLPNIGIKKLPTPDQSHAIELIKKVSQGHRKRPLVLSADRGRGKSAALGLAAATLTQAHQHKIIITAPSRMAARVAISHYEEEVDEPKRSLYFLSPDELLLQKPDCHLLLIDEAAAIPTAMLAEFVSHYSRVVFATTIHGYEGNGRGFAIRFRQYLDAHFESWHHFHLTQSIRWAAHDPLESWMSDLLLLNYDTETQAKSTLPPAELPTPSFKWLTQDELHRNSQLFQAAISLLVNAHYQTSPDDIRLILDHPKVSIGAVFMGSTLDARELSGIILLIHEGQISDQALQEDILFGRRRLRGHLTPQSLATIYNNPQLLELGYWRVMRIAVKPEHERAGLGTMMIDAAKQLASTTETVLATSFSFNDQLIRFWTKNGFRFLKLGTKKDNATGAYSCIMAVPRALNAINFETLRQGFAKQLWFGLSRQYQSHPSDTLLYILLDVLKEEHTDAEHHTYSLRSFSQGYRSLEDCHHELSDLLLSTLSDGSILKALPADKAAFLVAALLQSQTMQLCIKTYKLKGKKEFNQALRDCISDLIDHHSQGEN